MRKNIFKKALTLALAGAMAVGMATTGFAADAPADGTATLNSTTDKKTATLRLPKSFVVSNDAAYAGKTIEYPGITYKYTIEGTADAANYSVTLNNTKNTPATSQAVALKTGKTKAVSTTTPEIQIEKGSKVLNANGQELVTGYTDITFTAADFDVPGIYRFTLKENTANDNARINAGIVKSTEIAKDHYIDVYVSWQNPNPSDSNHYLIIDGFTLLSEDSNITGNDGDGDGVADNTIAAKESGLEDVPVTPDPTHGGDPTYNKLDATKGAMTVTNADMYYTYNVTLTKKVAGTMGDSEFGFQFAVDAVNETKDATPQTLGFLIEGYETKAKAEAAGTKDIQNATSGTAINTFLKAEQTATLVGLNPYAKVNYTETNNSTSIYTVTVADSAADITGKVDQSVAANATLAAYTDKTTILDNTGFVAEDSASTLGNAKAITYTNKLDAISPTGVALRFAPYIIMIGAALALVAFSRRRRENA